MLIVIMTSQLSKLAEWFEILNTEYLIWEKFVAENIRQ